MQEEITGASARQIRKEMGLSQEAFWGAVGVKRETGNNYERRGRITEPVRRLLFMHYVAGIPVDADPRELLRIGRIAQAGNAAVGALLSATECIGVAAAQLKTAVEAITEQEGQHG